MRAYIYTDSFSQFIKQYILVITNSNKIKVIKKMVGCDVAKIFGPVCLSKDKANLPSFSNHWLAVNETSVPNCGEGK